MIKKLARLVVIFVALATCLALVIPSVGSTQKEPDPTIPIEITATVPVTESTTPVTEDVAVEIETTPIVETIEVQEVVETTEAQEVVETTEPVFVIQDEYPEATYIWNVLQSWGWSPEACAGIIGNMMAEVGGGTLDFSNWDSNGGSGYGLIQWLNSRRTGIKNRYGDYPTIDEQLIYMRDELFGTNGVDQQVTEGQLNKILYSGTPEECAYAFACYFERCGEGHRWIRRSYARAAYEYFMN